LLKKSISKREREPCLWANNITVRGIGGLGSSDIIISVDITRQTARKQAILIPRFLAESVRYRKDMSLSSKEVVTGVMVDRVVSIK